MNIPEKYRRPLLIAGLIAATVLFGVVIYFVFFRSTGPRANGNVNENANLAVNGGLNLAGNRNLNKNAAVNGVGGLPISKVANGGETLANPLTKSGVKYVIPDGNGRDLIYYDPATGLFYRMSPDGSNVTPISSERFPQVSNVTWAPDRNKAILEFPDNSKIFYDFNAKKQVTLPREATDFSFSPNSDRVAWKFYGSNAQDRWLQVADPTGSNAQTLEPLGDNADRVDVNWSPSNQIVATFRQSSGLESEEIQPIGLNNENLLSMPVDGRGFTGRWGPGGTRLLYSTYSSTTNYNPELWLAGFQGATVGNERVGLGLNTWPDKCAFTINASALYCAVPRYLDAGSGIYPELAASVPDEFYKIDLNTGAKERIAIPVGADDNRNFSAKNVYVSADGGTLFFTDQVSGKTYSMLLK